VIRGGFWELRIGGLGVCVIMMNAMRQ
jgi:hypothetical protein